MAKDTEKNTYSALEQEFIAETKSAFDQLSGEISQRNQTIADRDGYIYGDLLEQNIDIPIGHDFTTVNWLRRTVEIHKNMFMGRGFQPISSYDTSDPDTGNQEDQKRINIENKKRKEYAELRQNTIQNIIQDNGGLAFWNNAAENASAVGDVCIKAYYDEDDKKYVLSLIESIENIYVLWCKDDFREYDAIAYVYQVSKEEAIDDYGAAENVATSPVGHPLQLVASNIPPNVSYSNQPMVTIMEVTGKIEGWAIENNRLKRVKIGEETELNVKIVGDKITGLISDEKKLPKYYILPNKRQRKRAWSASDITDAAININATYIETLSDWRTVSMKVNFPKYKGYGFGFDTQMPKSENRKIQVLPLADGQDIQQLDQGSSSQLDFNSQLNELKEQFVRETGISRVLFDDPSVTFNSNQALLTSMKPTSDIAEAKKQLWTPILTEIFTDALETLALVDPDTYGDLVDEEDNWSIKIMWPSIIQKEDPIFQNMLINRFNAGTLSLQSYLEQQGETKEEIDRIKEEVNDPVTAAILGKQLPAYAQAIINYATAEIQAAYQATMPQPTQNGAPNTPGVDSNGGLAAPQLGAGPAASVPGTGIVSQPGSGATPVSAGGAVAQTAQNVGA